MFCPLLIDCGECQGAEKGLDLKRELDWELFLCSVCIGLLEPEPSCLQGDPN